MSEIVVRIEQGDLKGKMENECNGISYYSFKGIPYAKPPLGILRFRAPQPPKSWKGIRDATKHGNRCLQAEFSPSITGKTMGSSDCLYLNVYISQLNGKKKAVMFWIHGGIFMFGSGNEEERGPDYLITEDIVLVTCNYRLGILGFLKVDDPEVGIPGNTGLRDIVMALKWVQKNINKFGGDPNNVTVFGESAGGAAAHLLSLSPLAKGLFHKVLCLSGSAICQWSLLQPEKNAIADLAKILNLTNKKDAEIVECLEKLSDQELIEAVLKLGFKTTKLHYFAPTIEKYSPEAFLPDDPLTLIKSGKVSNVPTIFGYTSREGILSIIDGKVKEIEELLPYNLGLQYKSPKYLEIVEKMKKFYFAGEEISKDTDEDIIYQVNSDIFVQYGVIKAAKELAKVNSENVYFYRLSFEGSFNNSVKEMLKVKTAGVCHGDDARYYMKMDRFPKLFLDGSKEDRTSKRIVKFWTNFGKFGNPNREGKTDLIPLLWKPLKCDEFNYLEIGENLTVGINPDWHRYQFWEEIYESINIEMNK